jgi:hypothetical protein
MTHPLVNLVKEQEFGLFLKGIVPNLICLAPVMQLHQAHQQGRCEGLVGGSIGHGIAMVCTDEDNTILKVFILQHAQGAFWCPNRL